MEASIFYPVKRKIPYDKKSLAKKKNKMVIVLCPKSCFDAPVIQIIIKTVKEGDPITITIFDPRGNQKINFMSCIIGKSLAKKKNKMVIVLCPESSSFSVYFNASATQTSIKTVKKGDLITITMFDLEDNQKIGFTSRIAKIFRG